MPTRHTFSALCLAALIGLMTLVAAPGARAQPDGVQAGVRAVINDQIAAFLEDDFEAAFAFASPSIQSMFGTPERFGAMVRQGYPMVHRPAELRFLALRTQGSRMVQRVMILDAGGRLHLLDYEMTGEGATWRISAVRLVPAPAPGV